jgi:hypothetical protein
MTEPKQCTPIPCPEFTSYDLGKIQPIAWDGIDITMDPRDGWEDKTLFGQAEELWNALVDQASYTRRAHRYSADTAIVVRLPDNPEFAEVFAVVKARAVHGSPIMIRLASEEVDG